MGARRVVGFLVGAALLAACNAVTGLGDLEFTRDPSAGGGGSGGAGGGGGAPPTGVRWALPFGDDAEDFPAMISFAPGGDVVLAGTFAGAMDIGGAVSTSVMLQPDGFVARFDPAGTPRFVATFDAGLGMDCVMDAATTSDGSVIALVAAGPITMDTYCYAANYPGYASMSRGLFLTALPRFSLRKFGPDGAAAPEIVLCETCSAMAIGPFSLAVDATGNIYAGGSFAGTFSLGGQSVTADGNEDALLIKLDPTGAPLWLQHFGAANGVANVVDLVFDAQGAPVVAGAFLTGINIGADMYTAAGQTDVFLTKLDPATGAPQWSKAFANAFYGATPRLAATADGFLMTGDLVNTVDFGGGPLSTQVQDGNSSDLYVAKFDGAGAHVWSKSFGEDASPLQREQGGLALGLEPGGNIVVAGVFGKSLDLGGGTLVTAVGLRDAFLLRLGADGTLLANRHIPSADANTTIGDLVVAVDGQGQVALSGAFIGTIDVGAGTPFQSQTQAQAYNDGFVVVYDEPFPAP